jgi:outer membrane lipoprotein SlyB
MARPVSDNKHLGIEIENARAELKEATARAKIRIEELVKIETEQARQKLLSAIRLAVLNGVSARQIGFSYGSSNASTIKALIEEAVGIEETKANSSSHPNWSIEQKHADGTFTVIAVNLGVNKLSGKAVMEVYDDPNYGKSLRNAERARYDDGEALWMTRQLVDNGHEQEVLEAYDGLE